MHPYLNVLLQLAFRWAHVVAATAWVGLLSWFVFANNPAQAALDASARRAVAVEITPRALYWFRWAAAWTWISGILLGGLVYYHSRLVFEDPHSGNPWLWLSVVLVILMAGYLVYNALMKKIANETIAVVIALVLFAGAYLLLERVGGFSGRALYIHAGSILGSMMAMNVWMVIWPKQQKILAAVKEGAPLAPDSPEVLMAAQRSRHNMYLSMPVIFTMISSHYPTMYTNPARDLCLVGVFVVGFITVRLLDRWSRTVPGI